MCLVADILLGILLGLTPLLVGLFDPRIGDSDGCIIGLIVLGISGILHLGRCLALLGARGLTLRLALFLRLVILCRGLFLLFDHLVGGCLVKFKISYLALGLYSLSLGRIFGGEILIRLGCAIRFGHG